MPQRHSAGILAYRITHGSLEVLLSHPGGPFFRRKDEGVWSIPKGLVEEGEAPLETAVREFGEETGVALPPPASTPPAPYLPLGEITQRGGKRVSAWAIEADLDPDTFVSNTFEMEWPRGSGRRQRFPEIDRSAWFDPAEAQRRVNPRQLPFIERLQAARGRG